MPGGMENTGAKLRALPLLSGVWADVGRLLQSGLRGRLATVFARHHIAGGLAVWSRWPAGRVRVADGLRARPLTMSA